MDEYPDAEAMEDLAPAPDLLAKYGDHIVTIAGMTGSIRDLSALCPLAPDDPRRTLDTDNVFVARIGNESGIEIAEEDAPYFERIIVDKHGLEPKYTVAAVVEPDKPRRTSEPVTPDVRLIGPKSAANVLPDTMVPMVPTMPALPVAPRPEAALARDDAVEQSRAAVMVAFTAIEDVRVAMTLAETAAGLNDTVEPRSVKALPAANTGRRGALPKHEGVPTEAPQAPVPLIIKDAVEIPLLVPVALPLEVLRAVPEPASFPALAAPALILAAVRLLPRRPRIAKPAIGTEQACPHAELAPTYAAADSELSDNQPQPESVDAVVENFGEALQAIVLAPQIVDGSINMYQDEVELQPTDQIEISPVPMIAVQVAERIAGLSPEESEAVSPVVRSIVTALSELKFIDGAIQDKTEGQTAVEALLATQETQEIRERMTALVAELFQDLAIEPTEEDIALFIDTILRPDFVSLQAEVVPQVDLEYAGTREAKRRLPRIGTWLMVVAGGLEQKLGKKVLHYTQSSDIVPSAA